MNERIGELYTQALEYTNSVVPAERRYNDIYYAIASAKHAKLIVQECAKVCLEQRDPANLNYKPSVKFADAVKQHFGVE